MISIKIVTNTSRKTIITDENSSVRDVLEANEVNYENAPVYIDGAPLGIGDHDKTFAQLGITEKCMLTSVVKTENA
jgi:hypothetical protein